MSRLDTQSDRLVRGPGSFEQQKSFLVQPQQFAAGNGNNVSQIVAGIAKVAGQVTEIKKEEKAKRKENTDITTYNKLLEARNRANNDPALYGDEYIEMYQSSLDSLEESDPLRTRVLALDADGFVKNKIKAEADTVTARVQTGMKKVFLSIGDSYESLSDEDRLEYIMLPESQRAERLYNEYLDAFLETNPDIHDSILNTPELELLLRNEVDRKSSSFQPGHNELLGNQREIRFQDTIDGIVTGFETTGKLDAKGMQGLADRNGIPVEHVQQTVLRRTLRSLELDLDQGTLSLGEVNERLNVLRGQAEVYGLDAEQAVFDSEVKFVNAAMEDVALTTEGEMYSQLKDNTPLPDILASIDQQLLSVLSDVTGVEYSEDDSILTVGAELGMPNKVLEALRTQYKAVRTHTDQVQRDRDARGRVKPKSSFDEMREAGPLNAIRNGDIAELQKNFGGDNDQQTSFNAGMAYTRMIQRSHPNNKEFVSDVVTSFVEGDINEFAYAIGGISLHNEGAFRAFVSDLPLEERAAMLRVQDELMGIDLNKTPIDDALRQRLRARYDEGTKLAADIGEIGSGEATSKFTKQILKTFKAPKGSKVSEEAQLEIQLTASRVQQGNLSDEEYRDRVVMAMQTSGNTLFLDAATGKVEVFDDNRPSDQRLLPQSMGHSEADIARDLRTSRRGFISRSVRGVASIGSDEPSGALRFLTHTPILGEVIARDLGIATQSTDTAMLDVAAVATSNAISEGLGSNPLYVESVKQLFESDDATNRLELGIGLDNGRPYLMATGYINGHAYTGQNALLIAPWKQQWNNAVGKSKEYIDMLNEIEQAQQDFGFWWANPETTGGQARQLIETGISGVGRALDESSRTSEKTPPMRVGP